MRQVQGFLRAEAKNAVGVPLQFRQIVQRRRRHALGLGFDGFDGGLPGTRPRRDAVGLFAIGRQATQNERHFASLVAQGIGIWIGFQAFINMGVNLGALPTKGLTLPLMSYGGSAVLMNVVAVAVVLRIDYENRTLMKGGRA